MADVYIYIYIHTYIINVGFPKIMDTVFAVPTMSVYIYIYI